MTSTGGGIGVSLYDHGPADTVALAVAAEEFGLSSVWLGEHVAVPMHQSVEHPYRLDDDPPVLGPASRLLDVWSVLGAIASRTTGLELATGVYLLPLRPPVITALAAATVQQLSGGRFRLGVGSGWSPEEYAAVGVPFEHRGSLLDEYLDVVRMAFAGGSFEHHGRFVDIGSVHVVAEPTPVPVVIGGTSERALRRAAERGDGWYNPSTTTLEACRAIRDRIERLRAAAGTTGRRFRYHIRMTGLPTSADLERYRTAGFDDLVVSGHDVWPRDQRWTLLAKVERLGDVAGALLGS